MKRYGLWMALCLVLFFGAAWAVADEGPNHLPDEVLALFAAPRWEGYGVSSATNGGDMMDECSLYALVLKKGDHNTLCIVEKGADGYEITLETDQAIYQGDLLPDVLIDTGGDALYYSYQYDEGDITYALYSAMKVGQEWAMMGVVWHHGQQDNGHMETMLYAKEGALYGSRMWVDENGNIISDFGTSLIEASEDVAGFSQLTTFDIVEAMDYGQTFSQIRHN